MKVVVVGVGAVKKNTAVKAQSKAAEKKKTVSKSGPAMERRIAKLVLDHRQNGRKLARSILRRWRVRMPADEIDSVVDLSLCEAARRYSSKHGAAFLTFFFYHLRGHLVRAVTRAAQSSNIFIAQGQHNGIDTTEWQHGGSDAVSSCFSDHLLLYYRDSTTPEIEVLRKENIAQCRIALAKLDRLQQEIVSRSFEEDEPLIDIARQLGYSRCHISRVKKSALDRMHEILAQAGLTDRPRLELQEEDDEPMIDKTTLRPKSSRNRSRRRLLPIREKGKRTAYMISC